MSTRPRMLALFVLSLAAASAWAAEPGEVAPKFANPDLNGTYLQYGSVVGKKWVVVNFFATWCVPCKEELPALEELQMSVGAEKVQVIVFATDKEKENVKQYFQSRPTNLTVVLDPYQVTYLRYNKETDGLPVSFLIGPDGRIAMKAVPSTAAFIAEMKQKILATN